MPEFSRPEIDQNKRQKFFANLMRLEHLADELEVIMSAVLHSLAVQMEKVKGKGSLYQESAGELSNQEVDKVFEAREMIREEIKQLLDEQNKLVAEGMQITEDEKKLVTRVIELIKDKNK